MSEAKGGEAEATVNRLPSMDVFTVRHFALFGLLAPLLS